MWSYASGSWGCGAHWRGLWFQVVWRELPIASASIAAKELFLIVVATMVWGREWHGLTVRANSAAVDVINHRSAKDALLCHIMRCLFFACDTTVVAQHTPGVHEKMCPLFHPDAVSLSTPSYVPPDLPRGLSRPSWTSREWTTWFTSSLATL